MPEPNAETSSYVPDRQLSPKYAELSVSQAIVLVYQQTPELKWLGEAYREGDPTKRLQTVWLVKKEMEDQYGLKLRVLPDKKVEQITKNPHNVATLQKDWRGKMVLFMAKSAYEDSETAVIEIAHELGAFRLMQIYGSKDNIPSGLPSFDGRRKTLAATHYLDNLVWGRQDVDERLRVAKDFFWRNKSLVNRETLLIQRL